MSHVADHTGVFYTGPHFCGQIDAALVIENETRTLVFNQFWDTARARTDYWHPMRERFADDPARRFIPHRRNDEHIDHFEEGVCLDVAKKLYGRRFILVAQVTLVLSQAFPPDPQVPASIGKPS